MEMFLQGSYLTESINQMISLKLIRSQSRQLQFIIRHSKIKLTGVWVNTLENPFN